jgi:hypothetical protein
VKTTKPTVTSVLKFQTEAARSDKFRQLGARYVKPDDDTGHPLYKTAAGLVLRVKDPYNVEVLANCVC